MPPGLGGGGSLGVGIETTMGTYVPPSVFVPIMSESLEWTEDKYLSEQIRQQSIHSEAKPSYYHIEGDIEFEVDPNYLPYFLYATRHTATKSGAGPYEYKFVPNSAAVAGAPMKSLSFTMVKNNIVFSYVGCVLTGFEFTVDTDSGILMATLNVMGLREDGVKADPAEVWLAPELFGADSHQLYLGAAGVAPTFTTPDVNHNGFTFGVNFNGEAQNRIRADRGASYISFGITEGTVSAEIDFLDRANFDFFVATNKRAIRLESANGGATYTAGASAVRLQANNYFFNTYSVPLEGMGDLIAADTEGRMLGIVGGDAYEIHVKSPANIA
jgi:Phage tail tube protein